MPPKELNLFQSASQRLRISRNGAITMLVMDGQGAALCLTADFSPAQKWAQSRTAAPNSNMSAQKLLEKIEMLAARPGTTFASTRGNPKSLGGLLRAMISAGFDAKEWSLPNEVLNPPPELGTLEAKKEIEEKKAKAEAREAKFAAESKKPEQGTP
jgi:hypothetical protein